MSLDAIIAAEAAVAAAASAMVTATLPQRTSDRHSTDGHHTDAGKLTGGSSQQLPYSRRWVPPWVSGATPGAITAATAAAESAATGAAAAGALVLLLVPATMSIVLLLFLSLPRRLLPQPRVTGGPDRRASGVGQWQRQRRRWAASRSAPLPLARAPVRRVAPVPTSDPSDAAGPLLGSHGPHGTTAGQPAAQRHHRPWPETPREDGDISNTSTAARSTVATISAMTVANSRRWKNLFSIVRRLQALNPCRVVVRQLFSLSVSNWPLAS